MTNTKTSVKANGPCLTKQKMPGGFTPGIRDYSIMMNNQGQQGISPVQQAAPIAQQVAAASTTPGVAMAVNPVKIFNSLVFIKTSLNKWMTVSLSFIQWGDAISHGGLMSDMR